MPLLDIPPRCPERLSRRDRIARRLIRKAEAGLRSWHRAGAEQKVRFIKSLEPEIQALEAAGASVPTMAAFVASRFAEGARRGS